MNIHNRNPGSLATLARHMTGALVLPRLIAWAMLLCIVPATARAQEGINTEAATEPSPGVFMIREQVRYESYSDDPKGLDREVEEWRSNTTLSYGIVKGAAINLTIPIVHRRIDSDVEGESDTQAGVDDVMLMGQFRLWQHHFGPIDTARVSAMVGAEIPMGHDDLSSKTIEPMLGAVFTLIRQRHGVNLSLRYQFNSGDDEDYVRGGDGDADAFFYDTAYLYRIAPAMYQHDTTGAWYVMLEANGLYETNGDNELLLSPGIMYEGKQFAFEAAVQVPVWQDLDHRPETDFTVTVGVRFLF